MKVSSYPKLMIFWLSAYSENRYTVCRSVVLKNDTFGTVDIILINNLQFFSFFWFMKLSQLHGQYSSTLFLTKYESNLVVHGFCSPSHYNGGWLYILWKFAKILWWQNFFLHLWQDKPLWVELKTNGRVIFITILLHFHYFISLEAANTQKS